MKYPHLMVVQPPPVRVHGSTVILTKGFLEGVEATQPVVADLLRDRRQFGLDKYGTLLRTHNGRDPRIDALQEGLDQIVYLEQARLEALDKKDRVNVRLFTKLRLNAISIVDKLFNIIQAGETNASSTAPTTTGR